jgi:hypothetical protein
MECAYRFQPFSWCTNGRRKNIVGIGHSALPNNDESDTLDPNRILAIVSALKTDNGLQDVP